MSNMIRTFQYENVQVDVVFVYIAFSCSNKRVKYLYSKILENFYSSQNVELRSCRLCWPCFSEKRSGTYVCLDWHSLRVLGLVYCLNETEWTLRCSFLVSLFSLPISLFNMGVKA